VHRLPCRTKTRRDDSHVGLSDDGTTAQSERGSAGVRDLALAGVLEVRMTAHCSVRTFGPLDLVRIGFCADRSWFTLEAGAAFGSDSGTMIPVEISAVFRVIQGKSEHRRSGQGRGSLDRTRERRLGRPPRSRGPIPRLAKGTGLKSTRLGDRGPADRLHRRTPATRLHGPAVPASSNACVSEQGSPARRRCSIFGTIIVPATSGHTSTSMQTNLRSYRLESAGSMFGVQGKLALAEYYTSLADPADFHWGVAVEHIGSRLKLSDPGLRRLAVAILQRRCRRRETKERRF
jgi:hypothetical protein